MANQSPLRDIEHLLRLAGLLVLGGVAFLVLRGLFIPATFGEYGHYRGSALEDAQDREPVFAGREVCEDCHVDVVDSRAGGAHESIGCESCHGALASHANAPTEVIPERPDPAGLCLGCHEYSAYRPATFPQVVEADHAMGEACDGCHQPHRPGFE